MKPLNLNDFFITLLLSISLFSFFTDNIGDSQIQLSNMFSGIQFFGVLLIAGILYLGYTARAKYDEYHKSRNQ